MIGYSLNELYEVIEIMKQGVWDHFRREQAELAMIEEVIGRVDDRRKGNPGEGLEKMYGQIQPEGLGRDKFCRILIQLGYGVRRGKNPIRTTIPAHKVFKNLIEGRTVDGPNQVCHRLGSRSWRWRRSSRCWLAEDNRSIWGCSGEVINTVYNCY